MRLVAEECKREIQTADVLITLITLMLLGVNELKVKCFAASRHEVGSRGMQKRNASPHRGIRLVAEECEREMLRRIAAGGS